MSLAKNEPPRSVPMTSNGNNSSSSPKSSAVDLPADELRSPDDSSAEAPLSSEDTQLIQREEKILREVIASITRQIRKKKERLQIERTRSRELTSSLVAATRDEDKAMLASDEAVSHALTDKNYEEIGSLSKLLLSPYFARFTVLEEGEDGDEKELEYRLGFLANPECRIVDWRRAPIAKLYYEYKEGDYYSELIQDRERNGEITERISVTIEESELIELTLREKSFQKVDGKWESRGSRRRRSDGLMSNIAALISADQFRLITEEADRAILIQGIAGSGKTTVALHRLAWLIRQKDRDINPEQCVIIVLSKSLAAYISNVLPSMGIEGVSVRTYADWRERLLRKALPEFFEDGVPRRPSTIAPLRTSILYDLPVFVACVEQLAREGKTQSPHTILVESLQRAKERILNSDVSKLIDEPFIEKTCLRLERDLSAGCIDSKDEAALLHIKTLQLGSANALLGFPGYDHLVLDEAQDYGLSDLNCLLGLVGNPRDVTLVGDSAQEIREKRRFMGWARIQQRWGLDEEASQFVSLTVSHRSSLPIMKLADYFQGRELVSEGRKGRTPLWFRCIRESTAVKAAMDWLGKAMQIYPNQLSAVICSEPAAAREVYELLKPSFGNILRLWSGNEFSFEEGLVVTDLEHVRGLEFCNVLLWGVSAKNYPDSDRSRNQLYTAATRAEENLCIISSGKASPLMPKSGSGLVRVVRELIEDE